MLLEPDNIYCLGCREGLELLENESIPLTVTSPPYDELREYGGHSWDFNIFMQVANGLWRVTRKGGIVVLVVGDSTIGGSETGASFRQALYFKEIGFRLHDTMIYQKTGPAYPDHVRYYNVFEYMFVLSKGKPKTFNPIKDRENRWYGQKWSKFRTRRNKAGELKRTDWIETEGDKTGVRFNIWKYAVGSGNSYMDEVVKQHPAVFPEKLAVDHILSWSNKNDIILDPFMGSGTVAIACMRTGRRWIGFEIAPEYCALIEKRVENEHRNNIMNT